VGDRVVLAEKEFCVSSCDDGGSHPVLGDEVVVVAEWRRSPGEGQDKRVAADAAASAPGRGGPDADA